MIKWILSALGFVYRGIFGGLIGFLIGMVLENTSWFSDGKSSGKSRENNNVKGEDSYDFELNLLALCAIVISADGYASVEELHYVRNYFIRLYGQEKAQRIFQRYNKVKAQHPPLREICFIINRRTTYQTRLQIVHFLLEIALVDGTLHSNEIKKIQEIAQFFRISQTDFYETLAFFSTQRTTRGSRAEEGLFQAYSILGITSEATDAEVKQAYRNMAKKYHPDRVVTQDEAIKKSAEEKFKKVQQAYEQIQKHRGL